MLKRQSKMLSIALIFVFCMSFMFAGFVAPQVAQANVTYQALNIPTMDANTTNNPLGTMQIDIDNVAAIQAGDVLTISFDSKVDLSNGTGTTGVQIAPDIATARGAKGVGDTDVYVAVPSSIGTTPNGLDDTVSFRSATITPTGTTLDIVFSGTLRATAGTNSGRMLIYFDRVKVGSLDGDVSAMVLGPAGGAFPNGNVIVGKVDVTGSTVTTIKSAKTFGSEGLAATDSIIISETTPGVLIKSTDSATDFNTLKLKLPNGFTWGASAGSYNWGFSTSVGLPGFACRPDTDARVLLINLVGNPTVKAAPWNTTSLTGSGQIRFSAPITVNDSIAKEGEVVARLYDSKGRITETDIVVGNYASYSVKVVEGDVKELISGQSEQRIGKFFIEEGLPGSLLPGRSVKLTLPAGVKWWAGYRNEGPGGTVNFIPDIKIKSGDITATNLDSTNARDFLVGTNFASDVDEGRTLKFSVVAPGSTSKSKLEFDNMNVDISPDFTGDVVIKVTSDAGVTGEVKVATVKARVELKCESVKNVRIGEQDQALGDLVITESGREAIALRSNVVYTNKILAPVIGTVAGGGVLTTLNLSLPAGATWSAGYPKVEVTEGDLDLDTNNMSKAYDAATGIHSITIPVKSESTKPSTIKVSGMKATVNRTVPEGAFKVTVTGLAVNETGGRFGGNDLPFASFEGNKVAIANCVTPAPDEGTEGAAAGQFKIDSNIYQLNGVAKVMDVAPYIKSGRTYVPVRYLGYALGVAEADVVWDEASQKVTLTKGDNVVELTIGSATITVNGETQTMDVAPEITNGRTMLPARYVAEGLGYVVGWDPGTRTVLISK